MPPWALSGLLAQVRVPEACTAALPTALQCSVLQEQPENNRAARQGAEGALGAWVWSPGGRGAGNAIFCVTEAKYWDRAFL